METRVENMEEKVGDAEQLHVALGVSTLSAGEKIYRQKDLQEFEDYFKKHGINDKTIQMSVLEKGDKNPTDVLLVLHRGAIEFAQWLSKLNARISFFSGGSEGRDKPFVKEFLTLALGEAEYEKMKDAVSIYSRDDMVHSTDALKSDQHRKFGLTYGNMKKDLSVTGKDLRRTVLIDNDPSYICPLQEKNSLIAHGTYGAHDFQIRKYAGLNDLLRLNNIFYITGILKKALDMTPKEGSFLDNLFKLQFRKGNKTEYEPIGSFIEEPGGSHDRAQYYQEGLKELQKINPKLEFYGAERLNKYLDLGLSDLSKLVEDNEFYEIKRVIAKEKASRDWQWKYSDNHFVESAVRDAILLGKDRLVELFLDEGVSVNTSAPQKESNSYISLIGFAAQSGKLEMVKLLLERGAEIAPHNSYFNKGDDSAITAAVESGHANIVDYLLEKGATSHGVIGYMDSRDTFLAHAAKHDHIEIVESLMKHGAESSIESSFGLAREKYVELSHRCERALRDKYSEKDRESIVKNISSSKKNDEEHLAGLKKKNPEHAEAGYYAVAPIYEAELKKFDETKPELEKKIQECTQSYEKIVRILMDCAVGCDFSPADYRQLKFLHSLKTIAGINFVGISVGGHPVTHEMLAKEKLPGAEDAVVSLSDLAKMKDLSRREALQKRLDAAMQKRGLLVKDDIVNLIPLWRAAEIGDLDAVKTRLALGIDPNEKGDDLPIVLAVKNGHEAIVDLLRDHPKFDVKTLAVAIKTAQQSGNKKLAERLTDTQDINQFDREGNALLHCAVRDGNIENVKKLIARGADVNLKGSFGYPLDIAARRSYDKEWSGESSGNHIEILRILLSHKADPNLSYYGTAMESAGKAGSAQALAILLPITKKQDIVEESGFGSEKKEENFPWYTDIMFKSYGSSEWLAILKLLKAEGADLNQRDSGYAGETLLHRVMSSFPSMTSVYSAMRGLAQSIEGCEDRLPSNTVSNAHKDLIQNSQKAFFRHMQQLDFLLENGADPTIKSSRDGSTVLHSLIKNVDLGHVVNGYAKIIDKCLSRGFDINAKDAYGMTLLHIAASQGDLSLVKYLLARGADINAKNDNGRTPLHYAAAGNYSGIIHHASPRTTEYLLQRGADSTIEDKNGFTPILYSQAVSKDWVNTESFKRWERDVQQDWLEPFEKTFSTLNLGARPLPEKPASEAKFSAETQCYLDILSKKESNKEVLEILNLSEEDKQLLENYRDDVSHEVMEIPVVLNERVYDLKTLLSILEKDKKDPFTGASFNLSDIEPAVKTVCREIAVIIQIIKEKHPAPVAPKETVKSGIETLGLLANKKRRIDDMEEKEMECHKSKKMGCVIA